MAAKKFSYLFEGLPPLHWDTVYFDYDRPPVFLCRGLFKGRSIPKSIIKWQKIGTREHALLGEDDLSYRFSGITLRVSEQSDEANEAVMKFASEIKTAIREQRSSFSCLRSLRLPHLDVANATTYGQGGWLPQHKDNEDEHANDGIASVSLGAEATMVFGQDKDPAPKAIKLGDGDLVIFDRNLKHGVQQVRGDRINLTFRSWKKPFYDKAGFPYLNHKKRKARAQRNSRTEGSRSAHRPKAGRISGSH